MSEFQSQDRPLTNPADFSATLFEKPGLPHNLTVTGKALGDYRVQDVQLVRAHHQSGSCLVLDVIDRLGPVENPHPLFERVFPLEYKEDPAKHRYTHVEIVNGPKRFTIEVHLCCNTAGRGAFLCSHGGCRHARFLQTPAEDVVRVTSWSSTPIRR